jgi:hypothetical protein
VEHQLSQIQLPASAGCPIDHLDRHLRCQAESVRGRGTRRNNVLTRLLGQLFDEQMERRSAAPETADDGLNVDSPADPK